MKQLKFKHHASGIKSVICNTDEKWIDYEVEIDWYKKDAISKPDITKQVLIVYDVHPDNPWEREQIAGAMFDFDHTKYHRFDEQDDNQIVVYFIPIDMLL